MVCFELRFTLGDEYRRYCTLAQDEYPAQRTRLNIRPDRKTKRLDYHSNTGLI